MPERKTKDPILEELVSIKKLLILALYASDIPSEEINKAVGMGAPAVRAMFSKKNLKKAKIKKGE